MLHQFAVYVKHTRTNTKLIPLPIVNSACLHQHRTKFGKSQSVCTSTIPLPSISPELYTQHHGKANLPKLNRWCQHHVVLSAATNPGGPVFNTTQTAPFCEHNVNTMFMNICKHGLAHVHFVNAKSVSQTDPPERNAFDVPWSPSGRMKTLVCARCAVLGLHCHAHRGDATLLYHGSTVMARS